MSFATKKTMTSYDFMNDYSHKMQLWILHVKKYNHEFADYVTN
jgi:hypothetical protein